MGMADGTIPYGAPYLNFSYSFYTQLTRTCCWWFVKKKTLIKLLATPPIQYLSNFNRNISLCQLLWSTRSIAFYCIKKKCYESILLSSFSLLWTNKRSCTPIEVTFLPNPKLVIRKYKIWFMIFLKNQITKF